MIDCATQSVVIESPYPAFSDAFSAALQRAAARGVAVHLVTNSLASTNHPVVYAAYQNQKNVLLNSGVKIYEFIGTQHLHAKNLVIDQRIAMLGSYNFNQRSEMSDLEFCIVTEDPGAAAALLQSIAKRGASTQSVTATFIAAPLNSGTLLRRVTTRAAQIVAPLIRPLL
jgi:phosphatidylserine/phosphatidylglycerophosphate/cardiolipin synthase-like enzyme